MEVSYQIKAAAGYEIGRKYGGFIKRVKYWD